MLKASGWEDTKEPFRKKIHYPASAPNYTSTGGSNWPSFLFLPMKCGCARRAYTRLHQIGKIFVAVEANCHAESRN